VDFLWLFFLFLLLLFSAVVFSALLCSASVTPFPDTRSLAPFLIAMAVGTFWQCACLYFLAERMLPNHWYALPASLLSPLYPRSSHVYNNS
jgi:hypothetical protein